MKRPTVSETIDRLLRAERTEPAVKTASVSAPTTKAGAGLRELAGRLKQANTPSLTYAHLHAVKTAMVNPPEETAAAPVYEPKSQNAQAEGLRKVAFELRQAAEAEEARVFVKAAYALKAQRGLMLLREALETR